MDNMADRLQSLLSDEEGMKMIKALCDALAADDNAEKEPEFTASEDTANEGVTADTGEAQENRGFDIGTILMLQNLMNAGSGEDRNQQLLTALKPHLSAEKQKKVDKAVRILGLLKTAAVLKESGLLGELLDEGGI